MKYQGEIRRTKDRYSALIWNREVVDGSTDAAKRWSIYEAAKLLRRSAPRLQVTFGNVSNFMRKKSGAKRAHVLVQAKEPDVSSPSTAKPATRQRIQDVINEFPQSATASRAPQRADELKADRDRTACNRMQKAPPPSSETPSTGNDTGVCSA